MKIKQPTPNKIETTAFRKPKKKKTNMTKVRETFKRKPPRIGKDIPPKLGIIQVG